MRAYRTVNLVILCLLLYALVFVFVSPLMEKLFPTLWRCHHRALTGEPCPFCGLTGDMRNWLQGGNADSCENRCFPELVRFYFGILALRAAFTAASFRFETRRLPLVDAAVHLVFLSAVFPW